MNYLQPLSGRRQIIKMSIERQTKLGIQVLRDKVGKMEVWETIPQTLPDGRVRRKVGETLELDGAAYEVTKVSESGAEAKAKGRKKVEFTEVSTGKKVSYMATPTRTIHISEYREKN